jgi:two-component system, chemotaxis family, sensor kinase CheA
VNDEFSFSTGMPSDEMAQYLQMFVDETSEQLDELVEVLLVLETNPGSPSHLNESFRLIHSIKGAAAMMGLDSIALLTHHLENHFDRLRSGLRSLDRSMMNLILQCVDFLRDAVGKLRDGKPLFSSPELIEQLSQSLFEESTDAKEGPGHKRIIVYLDRAIELPELKAELILARLSDLGQVTRTSPTTDQLESLAELRTLQVWLTTSFDNETLRGATDIVGVELIEIDDINDADDMDVVDADRLAEPLSQEAAPVPQEDESVPAAIQPDADAPHESVALQSEPAATVASPIVAVPVEAPAMETVTMETVAMEPPVPAESQSKVVETVRVDIQRLDRLMNLAGELVVNRARFIQLASQMKETFKKSGLMTQLRDLCESLREQLVVGNGDGSPSGSSEMVDQRNREILASVAAFEEQLYVLEQGRRSFTQLTEAIDQFSRVSDGLQRGVLDTRMVPVGPLFNRFKRTVRDISNEMGKKVNFVIIGENTELDKRMIDELGDPLVHLVRNAIDHGLESESIRKSRGKSETGTLTLEAAHSGNHVLITISDDGGGINTQKVKKRAIERGLVSPMEVDAMTDHQIAQFIWAPGFSTAEVVSDISGRGVGMDIVKTRIGELNGTVEVDSQLGQGTRFVIKLPLTLAIIRSLLFQLEQGTFAAPIENVREIVSIRKQDVISVHGRDSMEVRGEFIPLVGIEDIFDWHGPSVFNHDGRTSEAEANSQTMSILILTSGTKAMGLVVEELKGCQDIVVKSLDENFTHIRGLAGASILGDGSVCLLLDVGSCLELARQRLRDRTHHRSAIAL